MGILRLMPLLTWEGVISLAAWAYSVSLLGKFSAFLSSLSWPAGAEDLGHFGVSYREVLILFEQWAGHRLLSEKVRPISSVPVSEGIEIWQGCRFISSLVRAQGKLPGELGRFLASARGVGAVLTRFNIWTFGDLSSSMP